MAGVGWGVVGVGWEKEIWAYKIFSIFFAFLKPFLFQAVN